MSVPVTLLLGACVGAPERATLSRPPAPTPDERWDQLGAAASSPPPLVAPREQDPSPDDERAYCFYVKRTQFDNGLCTIGKKRCAPFKKKVGEALNKEDSPYRGLFPLGNCLHVELPVHCFSMKEDFDSIDVCTPREEACYAVQQYLREHGRRTSYKCTERR